MKRILIQCANQIKRNAVVRKIVDGVEHIVISSMTLPDDVVMNGGLYPADEIAKSFKSLERTLAPVEHPTNADGSFLSATDPTAIHNFYAGAYNENVRQEGGRIAIDKVINVQEAQKSDKGKRLLERVEELENNNDARPIHTSTGVFLEVEVLDGPQTNTQGDEFTWVARNMVFDHDAILLDSVGAAQPHQGVGMAVNGAGVQFEVQHHTIDPIIHKKSTLQLAPDDTVWNQSEADGRIRLLVGSADAPDGFRLNIKTTSGDIALAYADAIDGAVKAVPAALRNAAERVRNADDMLAADRAEIMSFIDQHLDETRAEVGGLSFSEIREALRDAIGKEPMVMQSEWFYIEEIFPDKVIFEADDVLFSVLYRIDAGTANLVSLPLPVKREITYQPKTNQQEDAMKEIMLAALAAGGVTVNADTSDDDILLAYNKLLAATNSDGGAGTGDGAEGSGDAVSVAVNAAVAPLIEQIGSLETKLNATDGKELDDLATIVGNSDKYPGLDVDAAKLLGADTLKGMAANCATSYGLPLNANQSTSNSEQSAHSYEMPK